MNRDFAAASEREALSEPIKRTIGTFQVRARNSTLEQAGHLSAAREVEQHVHELGSAGARQLDTHTGEEFFGSQTRMTLQQLYLNHQCEREMATSKGLIAARENEQSPTTVDGRRPEVEDMLQTLLQSGGEQLVNRLKETDAELAAAECTQPEIGRLIESYYVPLLQSALELSDEEFNAEYPGEGQVTAAERAELAKAIDRHSLKCRRCRLKASSDWEWDEHVDKIADENFVKKNSNNLA